MSMPPQPRVEDESDLNNQAGERATPVPYIAGFILSLCFTFIPYNLVTNHLLTGSVLLALVLGIAVIQMIVQVVFFLHLGRERKPRWQLYFFGGTIFGVITVVVGSIFIMAHLNHNMDPSEISQKLSQDEGISQVEGTQTGACQTVNAEHVVTINNGVVSPAHIDAHYCDALIFTTEDNVQREIAFGPHPQHVPYAGQDELSISKGHSQMLMLSQTGSYSFHDHLAPQVEGNFTVTK